MPEHVVDRVAMSLNKQRRPIMGSKVLVLGLAYKADIDDVRESPSLDIIEELRERGAKVEYSDPFVPNAEFAGHKMRSQPLTPATLRRADCVVVATAHKQFPWSLILRHSKAVVDTRNAFKGKTSPKITRL
jgi:UDP-N-acetyl-D-glucosamine dehydrogenase